MLAKFFIDRPIFASVISILITLAGAISAFQLSISQYPPVTPPTIQVDCAYPGSSSKIVAETIAAPIEQRVNGVERMLYMASQSTSDGSYTLTITFETGTDPQPRAGSGSEPGEPRAAGVTGRGPGDGRSRPESGPRRFCSLSA